MFVDKRIVKRTWYPYFLSPSIQFIIYEIYIRHSHHNFVISNIMINWPITKFISQNIIYAATEPFFRNFNSKEKYIYLNYWDLKIAIYLFKIKNSKKRLCGGTDNDLTYSFRNRSIYHNIRYYKVAIKMANVNLVYYQLVRRWQKMRRGGC